jgi:predicted GH43/DUF377 family glycosyl hydrolase
MIQRFPENPIIKPSDVVPTMPGLVCECLLNPGAFEYNGRVGLLLRVAERPAPEAGWVSTPVLDPASDTGMRILRVRKDDPELVESDPRVFHYKGRPYLTTLSHLRLAWSDDGVHFQIEEKPTLLGEGAYEAFGIEDCRVEFSEGRYWLTYTAVSELGVAVGMISTAGWQTFERHGLIFPPHNKDCALFPEKIGGSYWALHRPSGVGVGGNYIWLAQSPDRLHWGGHTCIAATRPGMWDSERVGGGAAPIRTERGWLAIYHAADERVRYCLGLLLLDLDDPRRVLARSERPILEPEADYERRGFLGDVVFTNGHVVRGDEITLYYGASDTVICGARASLSALLATL